MYSKKIKSVEKPERESKAARMRRKVEESTETKILEAARTLFNKNGFGGTRIRDISKKAGVNIALLNYHFTNKDKLFQAIMANSASEFVQILLDVCNDKKTSLEKKIELCTSKYTDLLTKSPHIANFVVNEINNRPKAFEKKMQFRASIINSFIITQIEQAIAEKKLNIKSPLIFLTNLLGLIIFPYLGRPILKDFLEINSKEFSDLMAERKKMIPIWIKSMFFTK